jgi:uncharacterized protein
MRLYIFRCRTRPRMFGATRYETASNLPTNRCTGGWEFYERVDLTPRGILRYAVDTGTVRRLMQQRGWHVWDESPRDWKADEPGSIAPPAEQDDATADETAAEPEIVASDEPPEPSPPEASPEDEPESVPVHDEQPQPHTDTPRVAAEESREYTRRTGEPGSDPLERAREYLRRHKEQTASSPREDARHREAEPEKVASKESREVVRPEPEESAPSPQEPWRPTAEPATNVLEKAREYLRREATEAVPPREQPRSSEEPKVDPLERAREYLRRAEKESMPREPVPRPTEPELPVPTVVLEPERKIVAPTASNMLSFRSAAAVRLEMAETQKNVPRLPAHHQVAWFDIPVSDIDRAVQFYSAVLGIRLKKEQAGPGSAIAVLPHDDGHVGGALVQNLDSRPSESGPLLYLNANGRLDEALIQVEKLGGRVLAEKHSIAPFGFRAIVLDSEGNRIALHSM